ncbi:uncharacterized protein KGF55_001808 [Candida pseudojiufengensis]|uniref:uncharacterized protein n=1 Tax=Candida pseudojiufengensis TaxID=497109 RepID=UPI002224125B|nr:uncharacterized protein KGF55_001808 [Candida pseudojiufengensis]KAI5964738.1 hypothetical protein KGF55_001808 [Candida pseudojiufengensis]
MGHSVKENDQIEDNTYNQYIGNTDIPDDQVIESIFLEKKTLHADDAVDYEDIDELAEDELPEEEEPTNQIDDEEFDQLLYDGPIDSTGTDANNLLDTREETKAQEFADDQFDEMFGVEYQDDNEHFNNLESNNQYAEDEQDLGDIFLDDEESKRQKEELELKQKQATEKLKSVIAKLEERRNKRNLKHYFPSFSRDQPLDFHKLLATAPKYYRYNKPYLASHKVIKPLVPTKVNLEIDVDQRKLYKQPLTPYNPLKNTTSITQNDLDFIKNLQIKSSSIDSFIKQLDYVKRDWSNDDKFQNYSKDLILSTTDWDDEAILNAGDTNYTIKPIKELDFKVSSDDELDEDIFDGQIKLDKLKLDMNDPNLLFVPTKPKKEMKNLPHTSIERRFNLSNDNDYEILRRNYNTKQRSQLSNLNIEHSVPAMRLQTPFYKVRLSKIEARSHHRPLFYVRPGTLMSFSKLKLRKRKKDKGKALHEVFSKTTDLTTSDTANIVALEYAEQYPSILSNFGMGSKLINYYRKERADDNSRPKAQVGETHVLGIEDRSPFWNFGEVAPGDFVPTLYNNLVRAPIFRHEPKNTDFLLVRSQGAGSHQKYYMRPITFNFAVGNTFPVEVPAPHSRKVTNISKNRLKMIVYRVMNAKQAPRIAVKDVSKHFPEQSDMQSRQRLKEFMEYQRSGDDQGYWKVRGMNDIIPTEEDIRAMITPEDSTLMDIMQTGQQILDDTQTLFGEESKEKEKEKKKKEESVEEEERKTNRKKDQEVEIDVEEELAPWNLSRNFVIANQTKSMLQLNGEGDPTGIGLGFSMLRATQKNGFKPLFPQSQNEAIPKSNAAAHQQKLYEQEIKRIWYSQRSSLVDHGADFDLNQIYNEYKPANHEQIEEIKLKDQEKFDENKILRITRRVRDQNGVVQRKVQVINDPRLIRAYVKRKKLLEDELLRSADVDDILPTNDKELNKIRKKALEEKLANLEKRAKQSKAKKPPNDSIHAAAAAGATIIDANTVRLPDGSYVIGGKGIGKGNSTTRRCKSCGSFGHIRTNKTCPLYDQMIKGLLPKRPNFGTSNGTSGNAGSPPTTEQDTENNVNISGEATAIQSPAPAPQISTPNPTDIQMSPSSN